MNILIDTQCFLWAFLEPERLGEEAKQALADWNNTLFLSAVSAWEISIKYGIGKLKLPEPPDVYVPQRLLDKGITRLSIKFAHVLQVHSLPLIHKDPFDRLLIAQAQAESLTLLTADPILLHYGVDCLWGGTGKFNQGSEPS